MKQNLYFNMKLVRESISFERGQDPKKAMGISYSEQLRNKFLDYFNNKRYITDKDFYIKDGILHTWSTGRAETEHYFIAGSGLTKFLNISQMKTLIPCNNLGIRY